VTPIRELTHAQDYIYAYSLLINPFDHKVLSWAWNKEAEIHSAWIAVTYWHASSKSP
jgi:hypothetical protein